MRLALLVPVLAACIGRATPPEQVKLTQQQNEVLGKFARQVGEKEINILLKDPNDTTLPGLPVGDLLYILSKVNEDKLIKLVKGISATSTLELILAIKRVGCTRVNDNPLPAQYTFDATSVASMNSCKWNHFHLPNIMVQLLNGINDNGLTTLIDTVKHSYTNLACASNASGFLATDQALCPAPTMITTQPATTALADPLNAPFNPANQRYKVSVEHYAFLMKIAYVAAGFDYPQQATDPNFASETLSGPSKLYNLMNLTNDGRDMVFLLDSFDKGVCPGSCVNVTTGNILTVTAAGGNLWTDIQNGTQLLSLKNLLSIIDQVQDTSKMGILVNGYRPVSGRYDTSYDSGQLRYYMDRLRVVLERTTVCTAVSYPGTAAEQALQDFSNPQGGVAAWNTKLATLINLISIANVGRMMDLIYFIEDGYSLNHTSTFACPGRGIDNLMVMLNNLNNTPNIHNAPNTTNNELITAAYLIDNVALAPLDANPAKRNKVKYLVEYMGTTLDVLQLACYTAVADQVDGVAPADGTPETCDNRGLINLTADGSKLTDAAVADLTAAGQKLTNLLGQITEIEDMRFLVRKVSMSNMTQIIAGLQIVSTINVANLVNQISGFDCWGENFGLISTTVNAPGAGYTSAPAVTFGGTGAGATGKAVIETDTLNFAATLGQVKAVVVLNAGTGYNPAPTAVPLILTGGGGAGANVTARAGSCRFNATPPLEYRGFPSSAVAGATGATGLGKMVNVINHITGSPTTVVTMINGVTDGQKLGVLINGITRSSNLVGVVNATVDASRNNNATMTDLITLLNGITLADTYKLVHMLDNLGNATEIDNLITVPNGDHDMVAQLIAPYSRTGNLVDANSGVGVAAMANLVSSLSMHGGGGYTNGGTVTAPGGMTAVVNVATVNAVTGIEMNNVGAGCTSLPTVTITGGTGSGLQVAPYLWAGQVLRINILNGGSYTVAPTLTVSGGGCTTTPVATARINGIGTVTVTNGGTGYNNNGIALTISAGPGAGAVLVPTVSGTIEAPAFPGLGSYSSGTRYVTGNICPITGAGGSGGTCTIVAGATGNLTGCSAISGGNNYGVGRVVKIGGGATAVAAVSGGNIATGLGSAAGGLKIVDTGCGYGAAPAIQVIGCTTPPTVAIVFDGVSGRVTDLNVTAPGSGCTTGVKVRIGESPYAYHSDGATAIVQNVTAASGKVSAISVSEASVNAAQLVQLLDRDATGGGIAFNYRADDATWTPTSACSGSGLVPTVGVPCTGTDTLRPNISTREAMVRLLHHGVSPTTTSAKGFFNGAGGVGPGTLALDWPGLGPQYIAGAILNNVGSASTQTLVTLMNSDTISLEDTIILLGCGDHSTYSNGWTTFSWQQLCTAVGPGIW